MSSKNEEQDENKADFVLLQQRLARNAGAPAASSSSSSTTSTNSDTSVLSEIWPLRLSTSIIDDYVLGDVIGTGSYAQVRECIDRRSLERFAIKIVDTAYLKRKAPLSLVNQQQEIRLLKRLKHENIISMRECIMKDTKLYIVLDFCTYVLHDLLAHQPDKRLNADLARDLFTQLMHGMRYLHSLGIVHRDIKPQNLLITNCGKLKIIDFGVSHLLSMWQRDDICSNYEGSPLFQAPEVVTGQPKYAGYKVDVWSAGVTLYLMLFGRHPFEDDALLGLYDKILAEHWSIPAGICMPNLRILIDLLALMLDKCAERRASVERVMTHPWLQLRPKNHPKQSEGHSEFLELATCVSYMEQFTSTRTQQPAMDVYRSTSVLPYLHNIHYPEYTATKPRRSRSTTPTSCDTPETSRPTSVDPYNKDPHEVVDDQPIEWGTERQYKLLKIPRIRANRIKPKSRKVRRANRKNHFIT